MMSHHPVFRQEARRVEYKAEQEERGRVLRLIDSRIARERNKNLDVGVLTELRHAVQQGHQR